VNSHETEDWDMEGDVSRYCNSNISYVMKKIVYSAKNISFLRLWNRHIPLVQDASTQTDINVQDSGTMTDGIKYQDASTQTDDYVGAHVDVDSYVVVTECEEKGVQASITMVETTSQTCSTEPLSVFYQNMKNEAQLSCCTGLSSFSLLDGLCSAVERYKRRNHFLHTKDEVLMTLMKLKLNCSFTFLSVCFNVDRTTCARNFASNIEVLSSTLSNFIISPSRDSILNNLPYCFQDFPLTVFVLDCTEIPVCAPACIRCRTQCWSQYKKRPTIKLLIGITPDGVITYVGPCYGGKASDNFLFKISGLLDRCLPADCIMVDKGFLIEEECEARGVKVIRPAFKENNEQLGYEDCERSRKIASARVHVERVMERLKNFQILKDEIQWNYLQYMDDVVKCIAGIVNLSPPLLSDKAFDY